MVAPSSGAETVMLYMKVHETTAEADNEPVAVRLVWRTVEKNLAEETGLLWGHSLSIDAAVGQ
jgi:hypothetical protein